jgi:predicted dehydrogenase
MTLPSKPSVNRRRFIQQTGAIAAASTLVGTSATGYHIAQDNAIRIALIGCGGRGTGATDNALRVENGPIQLVAMADVFQDRLSASFNQLQKEHAKKMDVPEDSRYIGFDGYKAAMDELLPGDIAILATPPAFRWVHYKYAIERGINVFMEKPVTIDAPTSRRMLELNKAAMAKNMKVAVGLMCRHCDARKELFDRIKNGEIGDILLLRAYRTVGPTASAASQRRPEGKNELMYQIERFHSFLWASGGGYSDFLIHNIDECCWMKDAWPVEAKGTGGRHYRDGYVDQNFDHYSVEYTFADGTKLDLHGRTIAGCHDEFASYAHGTKAAAVISAAAHTPARCAISTSQRLNKNTNWSWQYPDNEANPYQLEWEHLIAAIRDDRAYNEVDRGVMASAVTSMGRMAAHTGQSITLEDFMELDHEFAPDVDKLVIDGPAPIKEDSEGRYPIPQPGVITETEY